MAYSTGSPFELSDKYSGYPIKGKDMKDNTFLADVSKATRSMSDYDRNHFSALVRLLITCYVEKQQRAAVFVSNDQLESATLASVNADDAELHQLIHFVSDLVGLQNHLQSNNAMRLN